jgi:hypothetical protein
VTDYGGVAYWAKRLGLALPPTRVRAPYSEADAKTEAAAVIREHGRFPSERALRRLGYSRLATAVRNAGGSTAFLARHRLADRPAPAPMAEGEGHETQDGNAPTQEA